MEYSISKNDKEIIELIDVSSINAKPQIIEATNEIKLVVPDEEKEEFMICFNEAIVLLGLNNQDNVNMLGKRMYALCDKILNA